MSTTATQLKTQLATALSTISGLRTFAYQPDQITPPVAWPVLEGVEYHGAMGSGLLTHRFRITCVVGRASERTAQKTLDKFIAYDGGVRAAIEADPTLDGYAQTTIVESANEITTLDASDSVYLMVTFRVLVYA